MRQQGALVADDQDKNEKMPYNIIGEGQTDQADIDRAEMAEREAMSLEEWSKRNLPSEKITFRWRYDNKSIQLYERRLHSLAKFNVGPAIQAWARSRLEWMRDERLFEMPDGVLVFSIDPEGDIDIQMEPQQPAPVIVDADLVWKDGVLVGANIPGSIWVVRDGSISMAPGPIRHAADTLVRDLAQAFHLELSDEPIAEGDIDDAEVFFANDEFGVIPCTGHEGETVDKFVKSFDKLWTLKR
jgi:hypothetical protein